MIIKDFFRGKRVGYYFMAGALVFGIVALILYQQTGATEFTPVLDNTVTASYIIFIVLAAAMLVYELRIVKFITQAVGLYAFLMYIVFEVNYITNLLVAIDPTELTASFVLTIVFGALAWICALVSAIMTKTGLTKFITKGESGQ
ncbi:MAG: hypothetical protein LUF82_02420 [Clostridia bacterium]|nr:hypothetical protein [Clostridia bacterium]